MIPALITKFHEAKINNFKSAEVWGSGNQFRDFLYVNDMASASTFIMNIKSDRLNALTLPMLSHINIGSGKEISIKEVSLLIKDIVGYEGNITFNTSMPDGTKKKLLDTTKIIDLGWKPKISLNEGLKKTYSWFLTNHY